jgi:hypothetical protein
MKLDEEIEHLYRSEFGRGFPYRDCRLIATQCGIDAAVLIPDLDTYFSEIAGFSSSATRLHLRTPEQLRRGKYWLSKSFFARYPSLSPCEASISEAITHELWRRLQVADELRQGLLRLLNGRGIEAL